MKRQLLFSLLFLFSFSTFPQTTIITHGYAAGTSDPIHTWMLDMANAIVKRAGSGVVRIYNKTTGNFDYVSGSGTRTVLLFDWWSDSNDFHKGFSEAAGDALFAALMKGKLQSNFNLDDLHFIGHSRGCVVNSEAVERLLVAGFPVEQVTYLDAHDWGEGSITLTDYDVNPDSINSGVEGWSGIKWADSYWQNALFSTDGRAVEGTYSVYKGTITHDSIHGWYYRTIWDTTYHEGYYYSLVGGASASRPPRTGLQRPTFFNFSTDGIVNGNFQRGSAILQAEPGWWYHGGDGDAYITNSYLVLSYGSSYRVHNRFYIPPGVNAITFNYKIHTSDNSGSIPDIDKMNVLVNGDTVVKNIWMDQQMSSWGQISFDVTKYQNTVDTMEFSLVDKLGGSSNISSEVWVDSVRFEMSTTSGPSFEINSLKCNIFPNPVYNKAIISYELKGDEFVNAGIYNIQGKLVVCLANNIRQSKGAHKFNFDGSVLNSGLYIYRMNAGKNLLESKMVILK